MGFEKRQGVDLENGLPSQEIVEAVNTSTNTNTDMNTNEQTPIENPPSSEEIMDHSSSARQDSERFRVDSPQDNINIGYNHPNESRCKDLLQSIFLSNLFPDNVRFISNQSHQIALFESIEVVRVLKFMGWTVWMITMMKGFINLTDWERDPSYTIREFFFYEITPVMQDCIVFAVIGRMYRKRGFDRLFPTLIPCILSCVCGSWSSEIWWMRNSITLYNLACTWPWQLWVFATGSITLIVIVLALHIRASIRDLTYLYRLVEVVMVLTICILPYVILQDPSFHLHHYYSFWMIGLVFNRNEWWSEFSQAIAFGQYVNGVAVYGRDRLIHNDFQSYNVGRPYGFHTMGRAADEPYHDWRNCISR